MKRRDDLIREATDEELSEKELENKDTDGGLSNYMVVKLHDGGWSKPIHTMSSTWNHIEEDVPGVHPEVQPHLDAVFEHNFKVHGIIQKIQDMAPTLAYALEDAWHRLNAADVESGEKISAIMEEIKPFLELER